MHQTNCSINKNRVNSAGEKDTGGKKKKEPRGRQRGIDYTESGERGFCSWLPAGALTFGPSRTPALCTQKYSYFSSPWPWWELLSDGRRRLCCSAQHGNANSSFSSPSTYQIGINPAFNLRQSFPAECVTYLFLSLC